MTNKNWRRKKLGLQTLFGKTPGGFFIPYRYAPSVRQPGTGAYPAITTLFDEASDQFREVLASMARYDQDLQAIGEDNPPAPRWDQDWFPTLDAAIAYTIVRENKPERIVEIGSGHSTRFYARAVSDGQLDTIISAIDPAPRAIIEGLDVSFHRSVVQDADRSIFDSLGPGDILSIDSSHILMPGTDVDMLFSEVLPALPSGLLLHIHDIFLPDGYPEDWAWRGYNEQNAVAAFLDPRIYQPIFASHFVNTRLKEVVANSPVGSLPGKASARPASLWLRRRS